MKTILLFLLLSFVGSSDAAASEGSCSRFPFSFLSPSGGREDFSRSFSNVYPDFSVTYHQPVRMIEFNRIAVLPRATKSAGFKPMMTRLSEKAYLDQPGIGLMRFNVFDPKTRTTETLFVTKPSQAKVTEAVSKTMLENYVQSMNRIYQKQFNLSADQMTLLEKQIKEMKDRSVLFTAHDTHVHPDFQSGVVAVFSDQPSVPLPLEAWTGKKVIRAEGEQVVELGRFISTNEHVGKEQETTTYLLGLVSSLLKSKPNLNRVIIKAAGPVQERMFMRYGFKRIQQNATGIHDFSKEALMEVSTEEFHQRMLGLLK